MPQFKLRTPCYAGGKWDCDNEAKYYVHFKGTGPDAHPGGYTTTVCEQHRITEKISEIEIPDKTLEQYSIDHHGGGKGVRCEHCDEMDFVIMGAAHDRILVYLEEWRPQAEVEEMLKDDPDAKYWYEYERDNGELQTSIIEGVRMVRAIPEQV